VVGYLAYRGLRKGRRRTARVLALGLVVLTAVDALLGLTLSVGGTTLLTQRGPLLRVVVRCLGLLAILYAIYAPDESGGGASP
jgi:arginine exporter protein ArgO